MPSVGLRFATSKLQRLEQLAAVRTLGFKGEALASLAEVSTLEVSSRCLGRFETFEKVMRGGQAVRCGPSLGAPRQRAGTTVRVRGVFFNQAVRQRQAAAADRWGRCGVCWARAACSAIANAAVIRGG
jgi:DNA mismatch repair protein MLH3